jgi:hypothetical protein
MQGRFVYTPDFERRLEDALSSERLGAYREILAPDAPFIDVISIYNANTAVSEALMGPIQIMEISVRNSIHREISRRYGADWYDRNKVGLDPAGNGAVMRLIRHYGASPRLATPAALATKIVSELTLGFWTNLFQRQYEDPLWRKCLRQAFPMLEGF